MISRALLAALIAVSALGCGAEPPFDPAATCAPDGTGGGTAAGAFPDLEARIPRESGGRAPDSVDSGRRCAADELATLSSHNVTSLRFAGGIWRLGDRSGFTLAAFSAPGLRAEWMAEFFEAGVRATRSAEGITRTAPTIAGVEVERIDALLDATFETIAVLPGEAGDVVRVVLVASDVGEVPTRAGHDERVAAAVTAWLADS